MKRKEIKFRCDEKTAEILSRIAKSNKCSEYAMVNHIVNQYLAERATEEKKRIMEMVVEANENILKCLRVLYRLEFMTDDEKRRFGAACIGKKLSTNSELLNKIMKQITTGDENG